MAAQQKTYPRFTLSQRLEHWVMALSFTVLIITGLPQRYALTFWGEPLIRSLGGIESTRVIHRGAAVIFMIVLIYHLISTLYRVYVLRVRLTMLPGLKDVTDLIDTIRYYLGLTRQHPKLPRYNFAEKIEYWAVIWGGVLMTLTGFMLWNPIATTRFFPGEFIPAAKAAHSAEALLAFLAIIIWHFYGVHIKTFNRSIFTGHLTREQMLAEHAAELEEIEAGRLPPPVLPEVKRRRERLFTPIAGVLTLVSLVGLYMFVTFEQTAITTLPPAETVQAFVPATPTATRTPIPSPTPQPSPTPNPAGAAEGPTGGTGVLTVNASIIPHTLEGREECLLCHSLEAANPFPENHINFPLSGCVVCHSTEAEGAPPSPITHKIEGREDCLMCHQLDLLPEDHQAVQFTSEDCLLCHALPGAVVEGAPATAEPAPAETTPASGEEAPTGQISFAEDILPVLKADCAVCHGEIAQGGLRVTGYRALVEGGENGPAFVPGSPDESLVVETMRGEHPRQLAEADLQMLIDWIAAGAENN